MNDRYYQPSDPVRDFIKSLERKIKMLEYENSHLQDKRTQDSNTIESLTGQLHYAQQFMSQLQEENAKLQAENLIMQKINSHNSEQVMFYYSTSETANKENIFLKEKIERYSQTIKEITIKLQKPKPGNRPLVTCEAKLDSIIIKLQKLIEKSLQEKHKLESTITSMQQSNNNNYVILMDIMEKNLTYNQELHRIIKSQLYEIASLRKKIQTLNATPPKIPLFFHAPPSFSTTPSTKPMGPPPPKRKKLTKTTLPPLAKTHEYSKAPKP